MDMTRTLRRFPMTFAPLTLLLGPLGCGSETPAPPTAAPLPAVPYVKDDVAETQPAPTTPAPMPSTATVETPASLDQAVDRDVHQTAAAVKDEVVDFRAGATRSANEAVDGAKDLSEKARQDAETAANRIKGGVQKAADDAKGKVRDAKGQVMKAAEDAKAEAERRAKALQDDARKSAESALDNLLGNPK